MFDFEIYCKDPQATVAISRQWEEDGLFYAELSYHTEKSVIPAEFGVKWQLPIVDHYCVWSPSIPFERHLRPNWRKSKTESRLASRMPLHGLVSATGQNKIMIALSDAAVPAAIATGVREEGALMECVVSVFTEPTAAITDYKVLLRLDLRPIRYDEAVRQAADWWEQDCGYTPAPVPQAAKEIVDSLWYSFHQQLSPDAILEECRRSAALGMKTVIIDDGWQTDDNSRGYSYCGDWELATKKIPDMKALSDGIHALGMKLMIWYSVPFVGSFSKAFSRFEDKMLSVKDRADLGKVGVLDPRYPDVREYLLNIYVDAVQKWNLDGLKLDFIDSFVFPAQDREDPRRDCTSLEEGVDRLMKAVHQVLIAINPEILLEFRQSYVGPMIRQYGNMLRVRDCPNDPMINRRAVVDLRLTSGKTAVHSDMLMWHTEDAPENVAVQLASVLYSVPQISVLIEKLPPAQYQTLQYYLDFWRKYRAVLLDGKLFADCPEAGYSQIYAEKEGVGVLTVWYDPLILRSAKHLAVINASAHPSLIVKGRKGTSFRTGDCQGNPLAAGNIDAELFEIAVPLGRMLFIE